MTDGFVVGRLLIAAPILSDPNFDRTIVLILDHDDEGALGVVLNRLSDMPVIEALPSWHDRAMAPAVVFSGGPVADGVAIGLGLATGDGDRPGEPSAESLAGWSRVIGPLGIIDLGRDAELASQIDSVRVFSGYAGWGPGQLEGELELGAWFVADARPADALTLWPERLWAEVLRRQGGSLALLALYPADPSLN